MITELERFAFNQARFVMMTAYTIERMEIREDLTFSQALERIRQTSNGRKYLGNVTDREIRREGTVPGSFMDANTDFGTWLNNEYGTYVEDFEEK